MLAAMRLDPVASVHRLHSPAEEEKTTRAQVLQDRPHVILISTNSTHFNQLHTALLRMFGRSS